MKRWVLAMVAGASAAAVPLFALQQENKQEPKKESRTAYIRRIFEKDRCSFGDACRIVLSLSKGEHTDAPFAEVRKELVSGGAITESWDSEESALVTKGTLAYMLCKTLGIKGGVTASVFGMSRRYAFRECVYVGLLSGRTDMEYVTGRELIDALTSAEVYREEGSTDSLRK